MPNTVEKGQGNLEGYRTSRLEAGYLRSKPMDERTPLLKGGGDGERRRSHTTGETSSVLDEEIPTFRGLPPHSQVFVGTPTPSKVDRDDADAEIAGEEVENLEAAARAEDRARVDGSSATATIGGILLLYVPVLLVASSLVPRSIFSAVLVSIFAWGAVTSTTTYLQITVQPSLSSLVAAAFVSFILLVQALVYQLCCAMDVETVLVDGRLYWYLSGQVMCEDETDLSKTHKALNITVQCICPFLTLASAAFSMVYVVKERAREENGSLNFPDGFPDAMSVDDASSTAASTSGHSSTTSAGGLGLWGSTGRRAFQTLPWFLSIQGLLAKCMRSGLGPDWTLVVVATFATMARRCLLTVPLLIFVVIKTLLGAFSCRPGSLKPVKYALVGYTFLFMAFYTACFIAEGYFDFTLREESFPSTSADFARIKRLRHQKSDFDRVARLVGAWEGDTVSDVVHLSLLAILIIAAMTSLKLIEVRSRTFGLLPEDLVDQGRSWQSPIVRKLREFLEGVAFILNPSLLFLTANVVPSLFGLVWVVLCFLSTMLRPSVALSRGIVVWGLFHVTAIFVGGFDEVVRNQEYLDMLGIDLDGVANPIAATAMILLSILYNILLSLSIVARMEADRLNRLHAPRTKTDSAPKNEVASATMNGHGSLIKRTTATPSSRPTSGTQAVEPRKDAKTEKNQTDPSNETSEPPKENQSFVQLSWAIVTQYFYVVAFFALFLAAVVRVDPFHFVYLLFFALMVSLRPVPSQLWSLLVLYSVALALTLYCLAVVHVSEEFTRSTWELTLYFVLAAVFITQRRIGRETTAQDALLHTWAHYALVVERSFVSAIAALNCLLIGIIALTQAASLVGFFYTFVFLVGSASLLATSLHSPPRPVKIMWIVFGGIFGIIVLLVYLLHLASRGLEDRFASNLEAIGLTLAGTGLTVGGSLLGLWPKVAVLMLTIAQLRVQWSTHTVSERELGDTPTAVVLFQKVLHFGNKALHLLSVYARIIATIFLFVAGIVSDSRCTNYELSVVNLLFFFLASIATWSTIARNSGWFWRVVQLFSGLLSFAMYILQLPWWGEGHQKGTLGYLGINTGCTKDELMYALLYPYLLVFIASAVCAKRRNLAPNTMGDRWYRFFAAPEEQLSLLAFYGITLMLFVGSMLRLTTVYGPLLFLIDCVVCWVGRRQMQEWGRMALLSITGFVLMWGQFLVALGLPPTFSNTRFLSDDSNVPTDLLQYFSLRPTKTDLFIMVFVWCSITVERVSLRARKEPPYHWFWGYPWNHVRSRLTMTDRLRNQHGKRVQLARQHNAFNLLQRLLGLHSTKEFPDAGGDPMQSFSKAKAAFYEWFPLFVLIVTLIHAVYDGTSTLAIPKLISLFLCLIYLHQIGDLPWHGNVWWCWILRYHALWVFCRMIYNIPHVTDSRDFYCVLKYIGVVPPPFLDANPPMLNPPHCSGQPYTITDVVFHGIVICLIWIQASNYENAEYGIVLCMKHQKEVHAAELGRHIREQRKRIIESRKRLEEEQLEARKELLECIRRNDPDSLGKVQLELKRRQGSLSPERRDSSVDGSWRGSSVSNANYGGQGQLEADAALQGSIVVMATGRNSRTMVPSASGPLGSPRVRQPDFSHQQQSATANDRSEQQESSHTRYGSYEPAARQAEGTVVLTEDLDASTIDVIVQIPSDRGPLPAVDGDSRTDKEIRPEDHVIAIEPDRKRRRRTFRQRWVTFVGAILRTVDSMILWLDRHSISPASSRIRLPIQNRPWTTAKVFYRFVLSYTDLGCYFLFSLQFALSPCIVTALLPMSVYLYAAVLNPRPHKHYWSVCLIYVQLIIAVKSIIKVAICEGQSTTAFIVTLGRVCVADYYLIDTLMDLLCMVALLLHADHLRSWGLWSETAVFDRSRSTTASIVSASPRSSDIHSRSLTPKQHVMLVIGNLVSNEEKVGTDHYKISFSLEFLSLLFVFFAYYKLLGIESTFTEALKHSILPGGLAITLIILFMLIVIDRVIYLSRGLVAKYVFDCIATFFYHIFTIWWFNDQVQFIRTYYREETFFLRGTLPLAIALCLAKCGFLFFGCLQVRHGYFRYQKHLMSKGNFKTPEFVFYYVGRLLPFVFDLKVVLDWSVTRSALKLGYWLKLEDICHEVYLVLVDRQDTLDVDDVKKDRKKDPYPRRFKYPIGFTVFVLLSVILLFPLLLYSSYSPVVQRNAVTSLEVTLSLEGTPPLWQSANRYIESSSKRRTDGDDGGDVSSRCCVLNSTVTGLLERTRPSLVGMGLSRDTVQLLTTNNYSSATWSISPPALERLLGVLEGNSTVTLILQIGVQSSISTLSSTTKAFLQQEIQLNEEQQRNFSNLLLGKQNLMKLKNLYTPFLFNYPAGDFQYFQQPRPSVNTVDCYLGSTGSAGNDQYFSLWCRTLFLHSNPSVERPWNGQSAQEARCESDDRCPNYEYVTGDGSGTDPQDAFGVAPFYVVVTSPAALSASILQSIGIVAAYTTFVLAIGRVLRFVVTGGAFRVTIEDLEDPSFLVSLVEYLYIARAQQDFQLELELYKQLVDTLRVTEILEKRTKEKIE